MFINAWIVKKRRMKRILLIVAISFFSCKNTSEKIETVQVSDTSIEESIEEKEEPKNTSEEKKENEKEFDSSLLFPFNMDLSNFKIKDVTDNEGGDCFASSRIHTKDEIRIIIDSLDCDIWGVNNSYYFLKNNTIIRVNQKVANGIEGYSEEAGLVIDNAKYAYSETVYDFSVKPYLKYARYDTLKKLDLYLLQSNFEKSELKNGQTIYDQLMAEYSEYKEAPLKNDSTLVLSEEYLGSLPLNNKKILDVYELRETFEGFEVTKNIGEQDGPDYFYFNIGDKISINTASTENQNLYQVWIKENSTVPDVYGVKIGMTYNELVEKRKNLKISTEHYHVYLSEEGSRIAYEMSLGDYKGPDKDNYSIEDIPNSKVIAIIWK